jgi:hypothetical protein
MMLALRGQIRGLLHLRKERRRPPRGPKPAIGDFVVLDDLRMTVQAGLSDSLWSWLVARGWRELRYRPERRHYRELSAVGVMELFDAPEEEREQVLRDAIERASTRPILGDPAALASYIRRQ